jgi:hypothetical protein
MSRLEVKILAMGVHAGTHRRALGVVEERSRNLAWSGCFEGGIVPELAWVFIWTGTGVLLCDIGTEVENGPTS